MPPAVAYYRVSTERQRRSGLGIEAQQAAVARFAEAAGFTLTAEFVEAASCRVLQEAPALILEIMAVPETDVGRTLGIDPKTLRKALPARTR